MRVKHQHCIIRFPCLFVFFFFLKSKYKIANIVIVANEQLFDPTNTRHEGKPYDRHRLVGGIFDGRVLHVHIHTQVVPIPCQCIDLYLSSQMFFNGGVNHITEKKHTRFIVYGFYF